MTLSLDLFNFIAYNIFGNMILCIICIVVVMALGLYKSNLPKEFIMISIFALLLFLTFFTGNTTIFIMLIIALAVYLAPRVITAIKPQA